MEEEEEEMETDAETALVVEEKETIAETALVVEEKETDAETALVVEVVCIPETPSTEVATRRVDAVVGVFATATRDSAVARAAARAASEDAPGARDAAPSSPCEAFLLLFVCFVSQKSFFFQFCFGLARCCGAGSHSRQADEHCARRLALVERC